MAGSGFGFPQYPQRPSVSPQDVGQMLVAKQQQAMMGAPSQQPMGGAPAGMGGPGAMGLGPADDPGVQFSMTDPSQASGSSDPIGGDPMLPSPFHIMAREMVQRSASLSGSQRGTQRSPAAPYDETQLRQLGLSTEEIQLMRATGAIK